MAARRSSAPIRWFQDRRIRTKIFSAVLVMIVTSLAVAGFAVRGLLASADRVHEVRAQGVSALIALGHVHQQEIKDRMLIANYALTDDAAGRAKWAAKIKDSDTELDQWAAQYDKFENVQASNANDGWATFKTKWAEFRKTRDVVMIPAADRRDLVGYVTARDQVAQPLIDAAADALDAEEASRAKVADDLVQASQDAADSAIRTIIVALVLGAGLGLLLATLMVRNISAGLGQVADALARLAKGDLTARAEVDSRDDIGLMAGSLNDAIGEVRQVVTVLNQTAATLASAAEEMSAITSQMANGVHAQSDQAGSSAAAAEQVSANVQTVAAATEEMSASVGEIAHSANEAARVGQGAVVLAGSTNAIVTNLSESSSKIGSVVATINAIAEQTNMLALNATIEAARAGEYGRGFAVVANEVKELAQETSKATAEIQDRVSSIQDDAAAVVAAISQIDGVVSEINDYQMTIASAVEEQTATTNEMSRNISDAATGTEGIARNVSGSATALAEAATGVAQMETTAGEIARMSSDLRVAVDRFTV